MKNTFKAIYNPFNRKLSVLYGNCVSNYTFEDLEEWVKINYNGTEESTYYLHIQLDYDGSLQLLFYFRKYGDDSLNEQIAICFYSEEMNNIPKQIKLVYNDTEFNAWYTYLFEGYPKIDIE